MTNLEMISSKSVHDCYADDSVEMHHDEVRKIYEAYADGHNEVDVDVVTWTETKDGSMTMLKIREWGLYDTDTALDDIVEALPIKDGVDMFRDRYTNGLVLRAYYYPTMTDVYFTFK